jgi:hypothetical protein
MEVPGNINGLDTIPAFDAAMCFDDFVKQTTF